MDSGQLEMQLKEAVKNTDKAGFKIMTGHLPLVYNNDRTISVDSRRWGEFSEYTLELGCKTASYARELGKEVGLLMLIDDLVEVPRDSNGKRKFQSWMVKEPDKHYATDKLPNSYNEIIARYNVEDLIVPQKRSFGETKLISERKLKVDHLNSKGKAPNECSMAYSSLLNNPELLDLGRDYLVSLIPGQCKGNLCQGILNVRDDLDSSHVFFPHVETLGGMIDTGEGFKQFGKPCSIDGMFEAGVYIQTTEGKND